MPQIWLGLLDAERLTRYYGRLSDRMRRINFALTVFTLLASTAAFASLMAPLPDLVSALCFVGVAAALIWMHLSEFSNSPGGAPSLRSYRSSAKTWPLNGGNSGSDRTRRESTPSLAQPNSSAGRTGLRRFTTAKTTTP